MKEEELLYALALQKTKGIGSINLKKLIEVCGNPKEVLKEKKETLKKINGIGNFKLKHLFEKTNLLAAEKELKMIVEHKIKPLYFLEDGYPKNLKNCIDGPILLFQEGDFDFENPRIITIVGTRKMTNYGRDFCERLLFDIKEYQPIIVSGFAYGVDICAHLEALKNNLQTVAVLAHGFGQVYPKTHKKYLSKVFENGGFMTEFWHDESPLPSNFLKRNRIVAGLSEATIVVESATKGGALVTADIANSYSRDVFAVPGRTTDYFSRGCNALIRDHKAALINSAEDLVSLLDWKKRALKKPSVQPQLFKKKR